MRTGELFGAAARASGAKAAEGRRHSATKTEGIKYLDFIGETRRLSYLTQDPEIEHRSFLRIVVATRR